MILLEQPYEEAHAEACVNEKLLVRVKFAPDIHILWVGLTNAIPSSLLGEMSRKSFETSPSLAS